MESFDTKLSPTQRFWRLLRPDSKDIRNIYIYALFAGLVSLSLPLGIQAIVNLIQGGKISAAWILLVAFVVAGVVIIGVLQIYQLRITENLQQKIFTRAAFEFAYRIPRVKLEALYRHYAPELMNRFFDTIQVQKGLSKILIDFSTATLQVIFGLILLSLYHPFFILFSVTLILLALVIFRLTAKRGLVTSLEESKHKYETAHWLEELARTATTFKLAGRTELALDKADRHVGRYLDAREAHFGVLVQQYWLMVGFKMLVVLGLLAIGGILVMEQLMNIGQFIAAEIIILLVMNSVEKLIMSLENIYDVLAALQKIGQVTDLPLERDKGLEMPRTEEGMGLNLDEVSFHYPEGKKSILDGLSMNIKPGERIMLTGRNGSGKSTLLQVIAGLYDVNTGSVTYDGFPKGNLNLDSLRSTIGDALMHEQLFEGTVIENISMGRKSASFENVKWVVEKLGLDEFIRNLPQGYDTMLEPQGKKLPGSVVRKLLLARSIADKPRLLLIEDLVDHLDRAERKKVIDFLTDNSNTWTLLVVSSDDYMAAHADRVVELSNGRVISDQKSSELGIDEIKEY